jgi:uncharacterized protein YcgL (UPF0745 family)
MHNLDQSISDAQIRSLYFQMRNDADLVEVPELIINFTGKPFDAVDFKIKVFKQLYHDIYPDKEDDLLRLL